MYAGWNGFRNETNFVINKFNLKAVVDLCQLFVRFATLQGWRIEDS